MSSLQQRIPSVAHMRLAAIAAATANLKAQLSELEGCAGRLEKPSCRRSICLPKFSSTARSNGMETIYRFGP
jgi:hypothetical protein